MPRALSKRFASRYWCLIRICAFRSANLAFHATFDMTPEDTGGKLFYELGGGQWNIPELRRLLEDVLPKNTEFRDLEVSHSFAPPSGWRDCC